MLDAGVTLAMGSDVPIESIDPRRSLHGAVLRTEAGGYPEGGWFARQRLTVEDVLRGFTIGAAIAAGKPAAAGTITIGAPADLTIWSDDPVTARPEELLGLGIEGCVIGGTPYLRGAGSVE
jgi:predicted amidohydrolase YtcJ